MFSVTLQGQGNQQQVKKWLSAARNYQILGTYAQTEMGHGTLACYGLVFTFNDIARWSATNQRNIEKI